MNSFPQKPPGQQTTATTNPMLSTQTSTPGAGFALSGTPSIASTAPPLLPFGGASMSTPTTGFTFGAAPNTTTTTTGLISGLMASSTPATTVTLGGLTTNTAAPSASLGFNFLPATTTAITGSITGLTTNASSGFPLASTTSAPTTTAGFSLTTTNPPTTTISSAFSLPAATSTAVTQSSGFTLGATVSAPTAFTLNKSTAATTTTSTTLPTTNTAQTTLGTTTTVTPSSSGQTGAMNFCQLEEAINKWTLELEEQEKVFMNQAAQINAWDKLLIANGEKIVTLNKQVEQVKLEQQQLEHELDYVVGQQKELQDCLVPLEKELSSITVSDPEREYTYRLAEKLDTQLKQMSEDLKEIIEHLNEANRAQDSSDPIVQIGKILNAHMNSLQWIDQRTSMLAQKIQQIDQMHQNFRQENERSFSLAYN